MHHNYYTWIVSKFGFKFLEWKCIKKNLLIFYAIFHLHLETFFVFKETLIIYFYSLN